MPGKFSLTFAVLFLAWIAFTASINFQELIVGVLISFIIAALVRKNFIMGSATSKLNPRRWYYFFAFVFNLIGREIKAHLKLIGIILYPKRIVPQVVKIKSKLKHSAGLTALANSITMTPGTLTLDVEKSELQVHCITKIPEAQIWGKSESLLEKVVKK